MSGRIDASQPDRSAAANMSARPVDEPIYLRRDGACILLHSDGAALPTVLYWGADLGDLSASAVQMLARNSIPPLVSGEADLPVPLAVLPERSAGWMGTPGLQGHRHGTAGITSFTVTSVLADGRCVTYAATDDIAALGLAIEIELLAGGALRLRAGVTNRAREAYEVTALDVALPVPPDCDEMISMCGRHLRERAIQREAFTLGTHLRESRRSRGHSASLVTGVGRSRVRHRSGDVFAVHVAWSGNTRTFAEKSNLGVASLAGGELILPGEVLLAANETYEGPWVYASFGNGLDELSGRFHSYLRSRSQHPSTPRPVTLNVWEATYFDHDLPKLLELADRAAAVGVERFVLDDGWFSTRRDDTSGLGDWTVSEEAWPDGLGPLTDHVHALGMQFGLWFEPEMVSVRSQTAADHPEWILATPGREPLPARHQQVLNLSIPEAYRHVRDQVTDVLSAYPIEYLKWDYNCDIVEPVDQRDGSATAHRQTVALYRLIDEIKSAFPALEIESCAGGGGRIDLGILERTDRVWCSDCIDPIEQAMIQAGSSLLLPPELCGSHIGAPTSHSTGRTHSLDFRAVIPFFQHMGVEWDLTRASNEDLDRLTEWITAHKQSRGLLHTGTVVNGDPRSTSLRVHGVVSADKRQAVFAVMSLASSPVSPPGPVRLPGLSDEHTYHVAPLVPGNRTGSRRGEVAWWAGGTTLPGTAVARVGLQSPVLLPEQAVLLHAQAVAPVQQRHTQLMELT